jgi:hypothetical protein
MFQGFFFCRYYPFVFFTDDCIIKVCKIQLILVYVIRLKLKLHVLTCIRSSSGFSQVINRGEKEIHDY